MYHLFAVDPTSASATYLLTQGVLGVAVLVLGLVVRTIYNSREADRKEWRAEVKALTDARLEDSKEVTRDVTSVLQQNSQSNLVLAEKIETGKRNNQQ